jgi:hypothetical protein
MKPLSVVHFRQFGAAIENFQVAMIRKEPMPLSAGRLTNRAKFHQVRQSLRHSGSREGELLGCRRDRDVLKTFKDESFRVLGLVGVAITKPSFR